MKKLWHKLSESLPMLWGILWMGIITVGSLALLIWVIKMLLVVTGVIV